MFRDEDKKLKEIVERNSYQILKGKEYLTKNAEYTFSDS